MIRPPLPEDPVDDLEQVRRCCHDRLLVPFLPREPGVEAGDCAAGLGPHVDPCALANYPPEVPAPRLHYGAMVRLPPDEWVEGASPAYATRLDESSNLPI